MEQAQPPLLLEANGYLGGTRHWFELGKRPIEIDCMVLKEEEWLRLPEPIRNGWSTSPLTNGYLHVLRIIV